MIRLSPELISKQPVGPFTAIDVTYALVFLTDYQDVDTRPLRNRYINKVVGEITHILFTLTSCICNGHTRIILNCHGSLCNASDLPIRYLCSRVPFHFPQCWIFYWAPDPSLLLTLHLSMLVYSKHPTQVYYQHYPYFNFLLFSAPLSVNWYPTKITSAIDTPILIPTISLPFQCPISNEGSTQVNLVIVSNVFHSM